MMFRTNGIPFFEQIHDHVPLFTDMAGHAYCDIPEAIEYGENFIVHREGARGHAVPAERDRQHESAIRPEDYGIPLDAMGWDERTVRNVKMAWRRSRRPPNPLVEQGFRLPDDPKQRHSTHSQWAVTDWHFLWSSDFLGPHQTRARPASPSTRCT